MKTKPSPTTPSHGVFKPGANHLLKRTAGVVGACRKRYAILSRLAASTVLLAGVVSPELKAAELYAVGGGHADELGWSASRLGSYSLLGARYNDAKGADAGRAYVFYQPLETDARAWSFATLTASDGAAGDWFGYSVSLNGSLGLVGALNGDGMVANSGSAYVYHDLDNTSLPSNRTEAIKLYSSTGAAGDGFGGTVALKGGTALVGASNATGAAAGSGAAYVFWDLDDATPTGPRTESLTLTASDGAGGNKFGSSISLDGDVGLVGSSAGTGKVANSGKAYLFLDLNNRDLDPTRTETLVLRASDGAAGSKFGSSVSLSGAMAVVGAESHSGFGRAYVFRNLDDTDSPEIPRTESIQLVASDQTGAVSATFGSSVSLSGHTAIVGAAAHKGTGTAMGAAYLFTDLDVLNGPINETVRLYESARSDYNRFGISVSLDGDHFVIGASLGYDGPNRPGKGYSATVSSVTTLDAGNTSRVIKGISFVSRTDWTIGESTDQNQVTLSAGDSAEVTLAGKFVYIGRNAGSDGNALILKGTLKATDIYIGSALGNIGNLLRLDDTAALDALTLKLATGNVLQIEGDYTGVGDLFSYLGDTELQVWDETDWVTLDAGNFNLFLASHLDGEGYTHIQSIPEPGVLGLLLLAFGAQSVRSLTRQKREGNRQRA